MASEESDDEPLAVLAAAKKLEPEKFRISLGADIEIDYSVRPKRKKSKKSQKIVRKTPPLTIIRLQPKPSGPQVVQRPEDVWLYLKDFNPIGPYSCLLCDDLFINKTKMVLHYVLDHKKDYCGICRYFVNDRETWQSHVNFHKPWPCSQCATTFDTDDELRTHLSSAHQLVHCRLCHFRVTDNEQYHTHLLEKHGVTNVTSKNDDVFWELDYDDNQKFICLLCSKTNDVLTSFFGHYMGYHHFTLKCITKIITGKDTPFSVVGADVSQEFLENIKTKGKCGYVDLDQNKVLPFMEVTPHQILMEIKEEILSDTEEAKPNADDKNDTCRYYKGQEDFDVTLIELITLHKPFYQYLNQAFSSINSNVVPEISEVDYDGLKAEIPEIICPLCLTRFNEFELFENHMFEKHSVKTGQKYFCTVCGNSFESLEQLESHIAEEMADFDDLWICQFCDKEFDNRTNTRAHLTKHWELLDKDNCFSPHLGFKCKHCPILFWNEPDRELHHTTVHFEKYKADYFSCNCGDIFSDKIWLTYHYLSKHQDIDFVFKCSICSVVQASVETMREHFKKNHPQAKKLFCSLGDCQYKPLNHNRSFQVHLKAAHTTKTKERKCSCSICGKKFTSARACNAHVAQAHGPGRFRCGICKEVMQSVDERKLHYLINHPGHHPFQCNECGKSFPYKSSLYLHKQEHSPNKPNYTCQICHKVFAKKDSYREHIQIHEGPQHACSYCPMRFVQRSNMLRHERRHTGERPYACPHCDRTFADKGACNAHTKRHTKSPRFPCLYCGTSFAQKSKLMYHTRKHTGENLETCTVCSKMFTSACSLRAHMKTHGSRNKAEEVACPLCNKSYIDERGMLRHLRETHATRGLSCPVCNKQMANMTAMRIHVPTHGKTNMFRCKLCTKSYTMERTIRRHMRRRHGARSPKINIKEFYKRLDPRECQINIDETTMTSIFGPRKADEVLASELDKNLHEKAKLSENKNDEKNTDESDDDSDEKDDEVNEELEPTDFVSIKIEHIEEDCESEGE